MIISAIPISIRAPMARENAPSPLALSESHEEEGEVQGFRTPADRIPVLEGNEIHGIVTYSNLTYFDIQQKMSARLFSREESLAILMNPLLYRRKQDYYMPPDKFLLKKEEFEAMEPWKFVVGNQRKIKVKGLFRLYEYTSDDKCYVRRTLISSEGAEETEYNLVQRDPHKKRSLIFDDLDAFVRQSIDDCFNTWKGAKKCKTSTEADALMVTLANTILTRSSRGQPSSSGGTSDNIPQRSSHQNQDEDEANEDVEANEL